MAETLDSVANEARNSVLKYRDPLVRCSWETQVCNRKIKGLRIKLLIAWTKESAKENSCPHLRTFIVTSKPFNNFLKALFSAFLLLTQLVFPTLLLFLFSLFLLGFIGCDPLPPSKPGSYECSSGNEYCANRTTDSI